MASDGVAGDGAGPRSHRERLRQVTLADIRAAALRQVREHGAQALSLRAVAREVGMSNPGLYRYYASRDELLTALVAEAFDALAAALERARDARPDADVAERLRAVALGYLDWALAHPVEFHLVFGTPVPGYAAPADGPTVAAAARFGSVFVDLVAEAWRTGTRPDPPFEVPDPPPGQPDPGAAVALARMWTRLHGIVALALPGHLRQVGLDDAGVRRLYRAETDQLLAELRLPLR